MITKRLKSSRRREAIDITSLVADAVVGVKEGIAVVYVPHTTAGVTINESYDPDVAADILDKLEELVPFAGGYRHLEGNADAHIQATIVGSSVTVIVKDGKLVLGRWQGIFFMEFDGPRNREIYIEVVPAKESL